MPDFDDIGGDVLTETKTRLEKPKLYKVILHNDDFTTMEFVVFVLQYVFNRSDAEAYAYIGTDEKSIKEAKKNYVDDSGGGAR